LLTGAGCFTADWNLPGQVHAAFLRSDRAHARIRSIDTSAARALPGVLAVLTGDDIKAAGYKPLPSNAPGPGYQGSPFRLPERHGLAQGQQFEGPLFNFLLYLVDAGITAHGPFGRDAVAAGDGLYGGGKLGFGKPPHLSHQGGESLQLFPEGFDSVLGHRGLSIGN